jgi:uncharacterized protein YdhG (YjbR/CyaY superfamily)
MHIIKPGNDNTEYLFNSFLSTLDPQFRQCLSKLHQLIKSIVPGAEETFSDQVHCFKRICMLVGIGTTNQYCSLYTISSKLVKQIKNELAGCKISGITLHFNANEPLPVEIITPFF